MRNDTEAGVCALEDEGSGRVLASRVPTPDNEDETGRDAALILKGESVRVIYRE